MRSRTRRLAHAMDTEQDRRIEKSLAFILLAGLTAVLVIDLSPASPDLSIPIIVGEAVIFVASILYILRHIYREPTQRDGPFPLLPAAVAVITATGILFFLDYQGPMLYLKASLLTLGVALGIAGYWQKYRRYKQTRQRDQ